MNISVFNDKVSQNIVGAFRELESDSHDLVRLLNLCATLVHAGISIYVARTYESTRRIR